MTEIVLLVCVSRVIAGSMNEPSAAETTAIYQRLSLEPPSSSLDYHVPHFVAVPLCKLCRRAVDLGCRQ